jgi:serine/threonine protein kinase
MNQPVPTEARYESGTLLPGTVYRVVRELGRGGMGRVYEVEDTTVGKRYAVKVLLSTRSRDSAELLARMRQESRTLARLAHPNIVDVITAGVTLDGAAYYVMALLNGNSLGKVLLKAKRLESPEVVAIGIDVAEALEKAHENGIVHRDVKPDNIFIVVREDMIPRGVLVDFGVAGLFRDLERQKGDEGKLLGTPRYAAPEQQRGEKVTPKMDAWSLGMTLFEAIVGHGPFKGRTLKEIILAMQGPEPAARIGDFLQHIDPELDELVARMLDKDPARRPDMTQVTRELKAIRKRLETQGHTISDTSRTLETLAHAAFPTSSGDTVPPTAENALAAMAKRTSEPAPDARGVRARTVTSPLANVENASGEGASGIAGWTPSISGDRYLAIEEARNPTPAPVRRDADSVDSAPAAPSVVFEPAFASSRIDNETSLPSPHPLSARAKRARWIALSATGGVTVLGALAFVTLRMKPPVAAAVMADAPPITSAAHAPPGVAPIIPAQTAHSESLPSAATVAPPAPLHAAGVEPGGSAAAAAPSHPPAARTTTPAAPHASAHAQPTSEFAQKLDDFPPFESPPPKPARPATSAASRAAAPPAATGSAGKREIDLDSILER